MLSKKSRAKRRQRENEIWFRCVLIACICHIGKKAEELVPVRLFCRVVDVQEFLVPNRMYFNKN
jgi:hypothetical protein